MAFSVVEAGTAELLPWRDMYRHEMNCQIICDSLHSRKGWTRSYFLNADGSPIGYGSIVIGGPWTGKPSIFEFYLLTSRRHRAFHLFELLLESTRADRIEAQTNDPAMSVMLHTYGRDIEYESILFHDGLRTSQALPETIFRPTQPTDAENMSPENRESLGAWVLEFDGSIAATGGVLYHYNRPYGDVYMQVYEPFRRRGFGSYIVQELKRICYEGGSVPAARCNPKNIVSRKTLQKAGFIPCACRLNAAVNR